MVDAGGSGQVNLSLSRLQRNFDYEYSAIYCVVC